MYVDNTGAISPIEKTGFFSVDTGTPPTAQAGKIVVQDKLVWKDDHWEQTYKQIPGPLLTAAEWLQHIGIGPAQQPTLIYLRMRLMAANLESDKLDAIEAYLQGILKAFAADQSPRNDWQLPTVTYQQAIQEATDLLDL